MAAFLSAWLVGSYASLPEQDITIAGSAETVPAGSYYLTDPTASLSLLAQVEAALVSAGLVGVSCVLMKNRKVKIGSAGAFAIAWTDTLLRDLLGFTGDLAAASSHEAPNISPLLWSPARPESPALTSFGIRGHKVHAVYHAVSPYTGETESTAHGYREYQRYRFPNVDTDRVRTTAGAGGEWQTWFDQVAVRAARWKLYRNVSEDPDSTSTATLGTPLGPEIYSAERRGVAWYLQRSRGYELIDRRADIDVPCHVPPEYT
jgi:hypothetical protein